MITVKWKPGDTVDTPCQEWQGKPTEYGYGARTVDSQYWRVHRYVIHEVGHDRWGRRLDHGECVMHLCDNRMCIRFDHLRVGSNAENQADKCAKGRHHDALKTHCPRGHPYSEANTRHHGGKRFCRTCGRAANTQSKKKARNRS